VAQGAGNPTFAGSAWPGDDQMPMLTDPLAGCKILKQRAVEVALGAIVDVLDDRRLPELGNLQTPCDATIVAVGRFTIDEQPEPVGVRQLLHLGIIVKFEERVGHGAQANGTQSFGSRMDQQGLISS
jgi:hypothetical protein